jgi:actinorhodin biosynthesis protein ActVIA
MRKLIPSLLFSFVLFTLVWNFTRSSAAAGTLTPQDHAAIQQLYAQYYLTIDAGDSEPWANTFTPDGVFNNTRGHDALVEFIRRGGTDRPLRHLHSNLKLVPTAEGADGHVYVVQIDITAKPISVATYSRYDDKLVKTPDGWRFKSRQRSSDTTIATGGGRSAQQTAPPR